MSEQNDLSELAAKYVNTTDRHIFLTGKAGTGKTTFLKDIIDNTFKNAVVAAPTGIAAINAGGVTLHSLLQLPFGMFIPENIELTEETLNVNTPRTLFREFRFNASKRQLIRQLELLIIDEVSMLRADLLDCIDLVLRHLRGRKQEPFGGLQILFIGDLLQLPPVVKNEDKALLNRYYNSPYFFDARALVNNPPIKVELQKIFRQTDDKFISVLNRLRNNAQSKEDIQLLNSYYRPDAENEALTGYIHLTTHNYKADNINQTKLQKLKGKSFIFEAEISGDFKEHLYPTIKKLELKEGSQVMFLKNDSTGEGRFFNGKIGQISALDSAGIKVKFEDGIEVYVDRYEWENKRYSLNKQTNDVEEKFLGKFEQYPIKLAWAVTVHKSQGLTFEKAILDLSGTFAPGQLYVALSRLTSLDGLVLSSKLPQNPPGIDELLKQYSSGFNDGKQLAEMLGNDRKQYIVRFSEQAFGLGVQLQALYYHTKSFDKDENRSVKQQYLTWTNDLTNDTRVLNDIGNNFNKEIKKIIKRDDYLLPLSGRLEKAWEYFSKEINALVDRISTHRKKVQKETRVTTYVKELKDFESKYHHQLGQIHRVFMLVKYASENTVLTKKLLKQSELHKPLALSIKTSKRDKTPTSEVSYSMFKVGKSIADIAVERGFAPSTIEGHLCKYVESGEIDVLKLLNKTKLDLILKRYAKGINGYGELKSALGDEISYGEIKIAIAYNTWQKDKEERAKSD